MKTKLLPLLGIILMMAAPSCKEEEVALVLPRSVSLQDENLTLVIGEEKALSATVLPEDATNKSVFWESSDGAVASISADGVVKALASGSAVITVSTANGCRDRCVVTVWDGKVHVQSVSVSEPTIDLLIASHRQLSATVLPANADNKSVSWDSSDKTVATVNNGDVVAVSPGRAIISVCTEDGGFTDRCVVTVSDIDLSISVSSVEALSCCSAKITAAVVLPTTVEGPVAKGVAISEDEAVPPATSIWVEDKTSEDGAIVVEAYPLKPARNYYAKAWVSVGEQMFFSEAAAFQTKSLSTLIQTAKASEVGAKKATLNAVVSLEGISYANKVVGFEVRAQGGEWTDAIAVASQPDSFSLTRTDFASDTQYEFSAFVVLDGIRYTAEPKTFHTVAIEVALSDEVNDLTENGATVSGQVSINVDEPIGRSATIYYGAGLSAAADLKAGGSSATLELAADGTFSKVLTGLSAGKTYYYYVEAVVDGSVINGTVKNFTLPGYTIEVQTKAVTDLAFTKATLQGDATVFTAGDNPSMTGKFIYGTDSDRSLLMTNGTAVGAYLWGSDGFYKPLTGLAPRTTYYYMAGVLCNEEYIYGPVVSFTTPGVTEPQAVDLGLTVKWADMNLGAEKSSEIGHYFMWGTVEFTDNFAWAGYPLCTGAYNRLTKYSVDASYGCNDGLTTLQPEDDMSTLLLGSEWRTPTVDDFNELKDNTVATQDVVDGVTGVRLTSTKEGFTSRSIFIPLSGVKSNNGVGNTNFVYLWTASLNESKSSYACFFTVNSSTWNPNLGNSENRYLGAPVRAIKP